LKDHIREIVVVDTGSSDDSVKVAKDLGARVYKVQFSDFGSIRTLTAHLSRQPWVLGLDSDETISEEDIPKFWDLIGRGDVSVWNLPRKRWADLEMKRQEELEAYPDWQPRLYRNEVGIVWTRRVHEKVSGELLGREDAPEGPHINHFQNVYKSGSRRAERNKFYRELFQKDLEEGVDHGGPPVADIDND